MNVPVGQRSVVLLTALALVATIALGLIGAPSPGWAASSTTVGTSQSTGNAAASLNPSSDVVGANVTITGSGFPGSSNVTVTFDGTSLALGRACKVDQSGSLSGCAIKVPSAGEGAHAVVLTVGSAIVDLTFTIPAFAPPESTALVTFTAIGLTLVTQLVTRRVVNLDAERRMKAELSAFNKEKRDATLANDKPKLEKLKKRELQMRQEQAKVSFARLKVSALTIVPLLVVYYLMASFLGGYNVVVASAPFALWPIVNADGSMVLFWWYMLSSFTFSAMLSRLLHTTT